MDNDKYKDMRLYARFELGQTASLAEKDSDKKFEVVVVDIGLGGLQLKSTDALPLEVLTVVSVNKDEKNVLHFHGHVRYTNFNVKDGVFMSGYKFSPQSMPERVAIAEFVREIFENQWEALAS